MEFRCVYDPELVTDKAAHGVKPRYERPRGGPSSDPRASVDWSLLKGRGKRSGWSGPAHRFSWSSRPNKDPKKPLPPTKYLITGLSSLTTRNDVYQSLTNVGDLAEYRLVVHPLTGAATGSCSVTFKSVSDATKCQKLIESNSLRIGLDTTSTLVMKPDPSGEREQEIISRVVTQAKYARAPKPSSHTAAGGAYGSVYDSMPVLTPFQRRTWLIENVGSNTYIYIASHWLPVHRITCSELQQFVASYNPNKVVANRQGFYIVFTDQGKAADCYSSMNGRSLRGYSAKMQLCNATSRPATAGASEMASSSGHTDASSAQNGKAGSALSDQDILIDKLTKDIADAFVRDLKTRVIAPFIKEHLTEIRAKSTQSDLIAQNVASEKVEEPPTLVPIRFRKKSSDRHNDTDLPKAKRPHLESKSEDQNTHKYIYDDDHEDPDPRMEQDEDTLPSSNDESVNMKDVLPELSDEEEDHLESPEPEIQSGGWQVGPGLLPHPVKPLAEDRYLSSFLKTITDEEDLHFAKAALSSSISSSDTGDPKVFLERVHAKEAIHRSLEEVGVQVDWTLPLKSCWRMEGYRKYSSDEKREWVPEYRRHKPLEVVQHPDENEIELPASAVTIEQQVERERREKRGQSRRLAKALNFNKTMYGMNTNLFLENQLNKSTKRVKLARSAIHDWGLYAGEAISAQDFVIEYVGEALREEFADIRERKYLSQGIDSSYLFRIDADVIVDATKQGNLARFINHSCQPNCVAKIITVEKRKRIALYAVRDIFVNEELTFDYKFAAEEGEERVVCFCGAEKCRGFLV